MVSKSDYKGEAPPIALALINFVFFDAGGFFMMGFEKRWIGHFVYYVLFCILMCLGFVFFYIPGIIIAILLITWKLLVALEVLEIATLIEGGSDVGEFDHPKWPWMGKLPMLHA